MDTWCYVIVLNGCVCVFVAKYMYTAIVINAVSIAVTVTVLILHNGDNSKPPPSWLMTSARNIAGALCMTVKLSRHEEVNNHGHHGQDKVKG